MTDDRFSEREKDLIMATDMFDLLRRTGHRVKAWKAVAPIMLSLWIEERRRIEREREKT